MCFSPEFSFGAGAILTVVGAASIRKATGVSQKVFAGIPIIFSLQQIIEGFLWLALTRPGYEELGDITTHIFLFMAQVVWPAYVPVSVLLLGGKGVGKKWLRLMAFTGILVSVYQLIQLYFFPVSAFVSEMHIVYQQRYPPTPFHLLTILYLMVTILPPFFSAQKKMWMLGAAVFFSSAITQMLFTNSFISVWCFFAALISVVVYVILAEMNPPILRSASA
jgi:hypothetical protein